MLISDDFSLAWPLCGETLLHLLPPSLEFVLGRAIFHFPVAWDRAAGRIGHGPPVLSPGCRRLPTWPLQRGLGSFLIYTTRFLSNPH